MIKIETRVETGLAPSQLAEQLWFFGGLGRARLLAMPKSAKSSAPLVSENGEEDVHLAHLECHPERSSRFAQRSSQNLQEVEWGDLGQLSLIIQADLGVGEQARQNVATIPTGKTRDAAVLAGFVFATCGEAAKAEAIALELGKNYPAIS